MRRTLPILATALALAAAGTAQADDGASYRRTIARTEAMASDASVQRLAAAHGLRALDLTWEDTGRYDGSSVGPNISDMTIQVQDCAAGRSDPDACSLHLMPVLRFDNFSDRTADVPMDKLRVPVGNATGDVLHTVPLTDVLGDLRSYLHDGSSWAGDATSLLAARDTHALVSAQAAFLPIPRGGEATFNPVLFNYQSSPGNPAVLTLLVTREGTSATIIDNERDGFAAGQTWGQRLFFNRDGERASLTGKRLSDAAADGTITGGTVRPGTDVGGLNMVMLIQVPLKHREPVREVYESDGVMAAGAAVPAPTAKVEAAVIGSGPVEGPYTEIDGQAIERDPDYPVRVTVQFYKATEDGVVTDADVARIRTQIDRVYDDGDYVGSLVVGADRRDRPTEYEGEHTEPRDWWPRFYQHVQADLGWSPVEILDIWRRMGAL